MKSFIAALFIFICGHASADEYRYHQMATTGLPDLLFDQQGKETTIVFSKNSSPRATFILEKILELEGISGTKGMDEWHGAPFEQAIILKGTLQPEIKKTASAPRAAEPEEYQEFILEEVMVRFPLVRHRAGRNFDTAFLETHFSFETLFPDGLLFEGAKVDFDRHTAKKAPGIDNKTTGNPAAKSP